MKKKLILFLLAGIYCHTTAQAQRYIIRLKDKQSNSYSISDPAAFLTQRAIARRSRYNILIDSTDLPLTARYLDSIRLSGTVTILNTSKWLNQVAIKTSDAAALAKISSFPFVVSTAVVASVNRTVIHPVNKQLSLPQTNAPFQPTTTDNIIGPYDYGYSNGQVKLNKGDFLHNHGFRGQGMQMSLLDAGFYHYLSLPAFDSIRLNNQVLGTWDFVQNETSVNEDFYHGMQCLSTIAANIPGTFIGTAPKTAFYLYRTEDDATEYPIEEQNFAAGLERSDSLGVDICSTSLGYYEFDDPSLDYTYADMNGNTTISAKAADLAAKKGMLLVIAAGNEGNGAWHYITTPADADSVLAVGAVDTLGVVAAFSSYGPSSDGQVKPSVAAVGRNAVVSNTIPGPPIYSNGTSFACPNMAGLSSCLWQAFPEVNNMSIISTLQQSASKAASPDTRMGYGIPDMKKAFVLLIRSLYQQNIRLEDCKTVLSWTAKNSADMNFVVERKLPSDVNYVPLDTLDGNGDFAAGNFAYTDDLAGVITPAAIDYRIRMNISTDTSFYFNMVTIPYNHPCNTYTFTGNGNWTDPANWAGNIVPPVILTAGSTIVIDPLVTGECVLNSSQDVLAGAHIIVRTGKKFRVPGDLDIQ